MSKFRVLLVILAAFLLSTIFGRWTQAKLSTLPLFSKWGIVSPQAPIVIHQREEVRVVDGADVIEASNRAVAYTATVTRAGSPVGVALAVSSDGVFVLPTSLSSGGGELALVMPGGNTVQISGMVADAATGLSFTKVSASGVSVVPFAESNTVRTGERLFFLQPGSLPRQGRIQITYATQSQADAIGSFRSSDEPRRSPGLQPAGSLTPGQPAFNTKAEAVGVWSGEAFISSDVLKRSVGLFLSGGSVPRPAFGFTYEQLADSARVVTVEKKTPAGSSGLVAGDRITAVGGTAIATDRSLELLLEQFLPGQEIVLTVDRAGAAQTIKIVPASR